MKVKGIPWSTRELSGNCSSITIPEPYSSTSGSIPDQLGSNSKLPKKPYVYQHQEKFDGPRNPENHVSLSTSQSSRSILGASDHVSHNSPQSCKLQSLSEYVEEGLLGQDLPFHQPTWAHRLHRLLSRTVPVADSRVLFPLHICGWRPGLKTASFVSKWNC